MFRILIHRAIGDVELQPYVTSQPEIIEKPHAEEDEYLVIASDGLWDVMNNNAVAKFVLNNSEDFLLIGKKLCQEAMILGSTDNVTALVIDLK